MKYAYLQEKVDALQFFLDLYFRIVVKIFIFLFYIINIHFHLRMKKRNNEIFSEFNKFNNTTLK